MGLKVGNLVRVMGWLSTEQVTDEYFKPVRDELGRVTKRDFLILFKAEIVEHTKKSELQPILIS